jgi:hypothetical protein
VIANDTRAVARFTFRAGFDLPATITPDDLTLASGEERAVDLRLDLASAPFAPGETATLALDVCADGRPRVRVWLDLKLDGVAP